MNILRSLQLWFLYYFLWAFFLYSLFGFLGFGTSPSDSLYGLSMIIAICHTAFKMKYGGFRGLFRPGRGLIGHLSREKIDREEKGKELVRMQMERMRESEDAARRFRSWLENGVLDYVNYESDLRVVSHKFETTSTDVINIIKKAVKQGTISGNFKDGDTHFISDNYIKNRIRDRIILNGNDT